MEASCRRSCDKDEKRAIAFGASMSRGASYLRRCGRDEERVIALGGGVAPGGVHRRNACVTWRAPPLLFSFPMPLPLLGIALRGVFNTAFCLSRGSFVSSTAYTPFHPASKLGAN